MASGVLVRAISSGSSYCGKEDNGIGETMAECEVEGVGDRTAGLGGTIARSGISPSFSITKERNGVGEARVFSEGSRLSCVSTHEPVNHRSKHARAGTHYVEMTCPLVGLRVLSQRLRLQELAAGRR